MASERDKELAKVKIYVDPFNPTLEKSTEEIKNEVMQWLDEQRVRFD